MSLNDNDLKQQILGTFFYMLYLVAMLQPVVPLIEYYSNKEYIASVLCENRDKPALACNGKCYLEKRLEKSSAQDTHDHSIPKIDLSKYPISTIDYISFEFKKFEEFKTPQFFNFTRYPQGYSNSLFRPPIV